MQSPVMAMLWEHWRLTLGESAWRLSFGLVAGSTALALSDSGPTIAVWILLSQHAMFSMSIAKLTGGRMIDGYRPGFPLQLLYTRPVRASTIVGVAMMYDAVSGAAMYAASAALLGLARDPLPPTAAASRGNGGGAAADGPSSTDQVGLASYYARFFDGRTTASGGCGIRSVSRSISPTAIPKSGRRTRTRARSPRRSWPRCTAGSRRCATIAR